MQCPICPRSDIPDDAAACPACGADLQPLRRVREMGQVAYNEAVHLARLGAADAALGRAAAALAIDGSLVPARTLLGKLLWQQGNRRAALHQLEQAAALAPADSDLRRLRAGLRRAEAIRWVVTVTAVAAATLLVAGVVALAAAWPARQLGRQVDTLAARLEGEVSQLRAEAAQRLQELAAYQVSHSHTDAEYAGTLARAEFWQQEAAAARAGADEFRAAGEAVRAELAAERARREQLAGQVTTLTRRVRELEEHLKQAAVQSGAAPAEPTP